MRRTVSMFTCLVGLAFAATAGVNDVQPSPILNLNAGVSYELIDSIRQGRVQVDTLFTMFTEEDQKHLPVRIDQRFTPLCAAAHGKRARQVKELIELGADVNAYCIDHRYVTNALQLAYGNVALQGKETDITRALKGAGAEVSAAWRDWAGNDRTLTDYREAEARGQGWEALKMLGSIAFQVAKGASGMGSIDARTAGALLVSSSKAVSASYQDDLARRPEDPELKRLIASLRTTPVDKNIHAFFPAAAEGQAWCAGVAPQELLIATLKKAGARLQNMVPCRCDPAPANAEGSVAVCGIAYADAPAAPRR